MTHPYGNENYSYYLPADCPCPPNVYNQKYKMYSKNFREDILTEMQQIIL